MLYGQSGRQGVGWDAWQMAAPDGRARGQAAGWGGGFAEVWLGQPLTLFFPPPLQRWAQAPPAT